MNQLTSCLKMADHPGRRRLGAAERFELKLNLDLRLWWKSQAHAYRVVYAILALTLAAAFLTALSILILPKPAEQSCN